MLGLRSLRAHNAQGSTPWNAVDLTGFWGKQAVGDLPSWLTWHCGSTVEPYQTYVHWHSNNSADIGETVAYFLSAPRGTRTLTTTRSSIRWASWMRRQTISRVHRPVPTGNGDHTA